MPHQMGFEKPVVYICASVCQLERLRDWVGQCAMSVQWVVLLFDFHLLCCGQPSHWSSLMMPL